MSDGVIKEASDIKLIVMACEAGMGSSLMAANQLKKLAKKAKLEVTVVHSAVHEIPPAADVVLAHTGLAKQAKAKAPQAAVIPFQMFFNDPKVTGLVKRIQAGEAIASEI